MTAVCFVMWPWHSSVGTQLPFFAVSQAPNWKHSISLVNSPPRFSQVLSWLWNYIPVFALHGLSAHSALYNSYMSESGRLSCFPAGLSVHRVSFNPHAGVGWVQLGHWGSMASLCSGWIKATQRDESHRWETVELGCHCYHRLAVRMNGEFCCFIAFCLSFSHKSIKCQIMHAGGGWLTC